MKDLISGVYNLIIDVPEERIIKAGKLGSSVFRKGFYVYTGSALNCLEARLSRHFRKDKNMHWHIDYLLEYARITDVIAYITNRRLECQINLAILNLKACKGIVPRFGSSDCKCPSHLLYFADKPDLSGIITSYLGKI